MNSRMLLPILALAPVFVGCTTARGKEPEPAEPAETIAESGNAFAVDMYKRLAGTEGNLFFSPTSIQTALAMTYAGARGDTAAQMETALHLPEDADDVHADFAKLIADLNEQRRVTTWTEKDGKVERGTKPAYELHLANALWGQERYPFKDEFLALTGECYDAALHEVDFAASAEARKTINTWVEKQTNDKITDLIPAGVLIELTRLVLTNAVYFKSDWAEQFEERATKDGDWHVSAAESYETPMMHQQEQFGYAEMESLQALSLPYKADELDMVILLPRERDGLGELEKGLTGEKLAGWLDALERKEVRVTMPKWKFTSRFGLKDVLSSMGMPAAFNRDKANFTGIADVEKLWIDAVLHKAYVAVDEDGTEAAAATAVVMRAEAITPEPPEVKVFTADHPFLFLIRHKDTGAILFMGRVAKPEWPDEDDG